MSNSLKLSPRYCPHTQRIVAVFVVLAAMAPAYGYAEPPVSPVAQEQQPAPQLMERAYVAPDQAPQPVSSAVPAGQPNAQPLPLSPPPVSVSPASPPGAAPTAPRFAIGLNLMHPAIYGLASTFFDHSYFVPVPIEGHVSINPQWGLATSLVYLKHKDGDYKVNGLQIGVGPRFTMVGEGLRGLYSTFKVGLGFRAGHDYREVNYYRIDISFQPEIGYSLAWGPPGVFLAFSLGVQLQKPVSETEHSDWEWNGLGKMINYYLPVVNITLGYGG
jgi:hypothetical protein